MQVVIFRHQPNFLRSTPPSAAIGEQSIDNIIPIDPISQKEKFVVLLQRILKEMGVINIYSIWGDLSTTGQELDHGLNIYGLLNAHFSV
jgi:hypothetical protein